MKKEYQAFLKVEREFTTARQKLENVLRDKIKFNFSITELGGDGLWVGWVI